MADLLTTRQVQNILGVDRTTIYRMVDDGQLPAIRVGKQWRFARAELERWLEGQAVSGAAGQAASAQSLPAMPAAGTPLAELIPLECAQMIQDAFADALSVMIVITDMDGQPVTQVSNPCTLYESVIRDPEALSQCVQHWQHMAGNVPLEPKFTSSALGLLCARGLIRLGNELKGMVFFGGIAPEPWPPATTEIAGIAAHFGLQPSLVEAHIDGVFYLDRAGRERVLHFVQRVADIMSHILEDRHALYGRLQAIASLTAL